MEVETDIEDRADIESAHRPSLVAWLEGEGFQCYDYENEEVLRKAALDHWDTEYKTSFKWSELSDDAKAHAKTTYFEPEHGWWRATYEQWKEDGQAKGFEIDDIYFSGFCCQGDGASWTGRVDLSVWVLANWEPVRAELMSILIYHSAVEPAMVDVTRSGRYSHSNTMHLASIVQGSFADDEVVNKPDSPFHGAQLTNLWEAFDPMGPTLYGLEEEVLTSIRAFADEIYEALEKEYEYQTSDEYIAETCEANDHVFDVDGDLI